MYEQIHSLGRFGTGRVSNSKDKLTIISKDTEGITRVFRSGRMCYHTLLGRGWSMSLSDCARASMHFEDGRLTQFTDAQGRRSMLYYRDGMLTCISSPEGCVYYDYNADKMLTNVTYPCGQRVYISYQDIDKIHDICIKDGTGTPLSAVSYIYGLDGDIEYVYEYTYEDGIRKERRFTDISVPSRAVIFTN